MAHHSVESMRDRAFLKGRTAFKNDAEYQAALRGEFDDAREDFSYEANEDPDDGESGEEDAEDPADEEAVKAELEDLEERIGGTKFLEVLERFMKDCSGREEPPYLPFPPIQDKEVTAIFRDGSGGLRLRYGAYGLEADRLERTMGAEAWLEVVKTWKGLSAVQVLNDWDDALCELAEEDETEKAEGTAKAAISDGEIRDPALAGLSEALVEDDLEEAFDFIKDSGSNDVELYCGKFLRWRYGAGTKRIVIVDDSHTQTWSIHNANDLFKAVVAADRRMRCEKLADALADLDSYNEEQSAKVLDIAKDVEKGMYADGKKFDFADENGDWFASVNVCKDGRVVVDVACKKAVEVSKEDFVKMTKKFFKGLGDPPKSAEEERPPTAQEVVLRREMERVKLLTTGRQVLNFARGIAVRPYADYEFKDAIGCVQMKVTLAPPRSGVLDGKPRVYVFGREAAGGFTLVSKEDFSRIAEQVLGE